MSSVGCHASMALMRRNSLESLTSATPAPEPAPPKPNSSAMSTHQNDPVLDKTGIRFIQTADIMYPTVKSFCLFHI